MNKIETKPGIENLIEEIDDIATELAHRVILYNDDFHILDEVVLHVQLATGKSQLEAIEITMEAHSRGRAVCFTGEKPDCEMVAFELRKVELTVEID